MLNHRSSLRRRTVHEFLALLALSSGLLAVGGNNDNGGILPNAGPGPVNGTQQTTDAVLAISGLAEGFEVDETRAVIAARAAIYGSVDFVTNAAPDDAEFTGYGPLVVEAAANGDVLLQGSGLLNPQIGLDLCIASAQTADARVALLAADLGDQPLADLLSGAAAPLLVLPLGDVPEIGLVAFEKLLAKHGAKAPSLRVTLVFVSRDHSGAVSMTAAAGYTGGGLLEIAFQ